MKSSMFLGATTIAILSFLAGQSYQRFLYEDKCLDMGGGKNPASYPICVIEIARDD